MSHDQLHFYSAVDTIQVYLKVWLIYISHFAQKKLSAWMKNLEYMT